MASDLTKTSFYGAGKASSLQGPKGEKGDQGNQGPPGPLIPLPTYNDNASALSAGLPRGTLYMRPSGQVYGVL